MASISKGRVAGCLLVFWLCLLSACQGKPDATASTAPVELTVISSGGFAEALDVLTPLFEQSTGMTLNISYGSSSGESTTAIPARLARGESFDVFILADYAMDKLIAEGHVDGASRHDLARSRIGMSVRAGAPRPDISTPENFIKVLREAKSFGYSASASGTYLSTDLLPRLGLWEELEPKAVKVVGDRVGTIVARGDVEIGFQQISELLPIEGADFVGPIPDEYQKITVFSAGASSQSVHPAEALRLLDYFGSAEVAEAVAATGLEPLAAAH